MLSVHLPESAGNETLSCPIHVKVDVDSRKVFVRDPMNDLPRADRGGRAVAALFDGERRRVAQAWRVAWDRAMDVVTTPRDSNSRSKKLSARRKRLVPRSIGR